MRTISLPSRAKLNLYLKVINKRPDGYHNLKTLFERVSLTDELSFKINQSGRIDIKCQHPQVPKGPRNLVYKVARLLQRTYGVRNGVDININKKIPVAAGLAGGSSNGAAAFQALNRLWALDLPENRLLEHAREIGSDVAFLLADTSWAIGTERGDEITPLKLRLKLWHILIVPRLKMYSAEVFRALNLRLTKEGDDVNILFRYLKNNNITKARGYLSNDLENSILRLAPRLKTVKNRLQSALGDKVIFSGSGPAVFGITDSQNQAESIKESLQSRYRQVFAVSTI